VKFTDLRKLVENGNIFYKTIVATKKQISVREVNGHILSLKK